MPIQLDVQDATAAAIGDEHGLSQDALDNVLQRRVEVHSQIEAQRQAGKLGFLDLPDDEATVRAILSFADSVAGRFRNLVVLGIGGSALGPLVLHRALNHAEWNVMSDAERGGRPRFFLVDNVDPELLLGTLDVCPLSETLFVAVSKSGTTAETVAALRYVMPELKGRLGENWREHLVLITDPEKGWLRELVREHGLTGFPVPPNVGGRFSALSAVGLLPAALLGVNLLEVLAGADHARNLRKQDSHEQDWPYQLAAVHWLADTSKGKSVSVMMPYAQALKEFAEWYAQLWAESLGKSQDLDGTRLEDGRGQSVVKALGATDQHSQLQLLLEGPNRHLTTLLNVREMRRNAPVPAAESPAESIAYLDGHTFQAVLDAEFAGTRGALRHQRRPSVTLTLDRLSASELGELLMGYELATAVAGRLYHVDAFDQPAVELGKRLAKQILRGEEPRL